MTGIFNIDSIDENVISSLFKNNIEESISLDYKAAGSLSQADGKKNEIAKDVSAFANSAGGTIIYGIEEKDHRPDGFSFIDGREFTKEWLENVIQSRIQQRIQNIRIVPIRFNGDIKKTIYVVNIPESPFTPHMASDKKYYRRWNFQSVAMKEYEIRNLYNRRSKTELRCNDITIGTGFANRSEGSIFEVRYPIHFDVENVGNEIETMYKLEIYIPRLAISTSPHSYI